MRIAILRLNVDDFGKVGFYNVQEIGLARQLNSLGHETFVFYLDKSIEEPKEFGKDNVVYLPCKSLGVHGIFNINYLKKYNLDGIVLFTDNQLWQKNVIKWCKKNGIKCLCYFGRIDTQSDRIINKLFYKYLFVRTYRALQESINVTKTENASQTMQRLGMPIHGIIPVGLDMNLLHKDTVSKKTIRVKLNLPKDKRILLFVGRLVPNKRPLFALDILNSLLDEDDNYLLVIIGKGALKDSLLKAIEEKGLSSKVKYLEAVPNDQIYQFYCASDCLINLCDNEIFGMTILESMFYRCPVVAMRADGPCDIINEGISGRLCSTYNIEEWKEKIKLSIGDTDVTDNAHRLIIERFNWNASARQFEKYLVTNN